MPRLRMPRPGHRAHFIKITMGTSPSTGKRGNSGFIARKLAAALGSFCEIDESMIRSRLLNPKKSKISLKDVRLKARVIREDCEQAIVVTGAIEEVVFRWKWNVIKGSIKKSSLIVKGAKIRMRPISAREVAVMQAKERLSSTTSFDSTINGDNLSEKKQSTFVKNILNQFMLKIEGLEVHLELPTAAGDPLTSSKKTVVLYGNHIELESLGKLKTDKLKKNNAFRRRKKANNRQDPLLQQLRIGSLSARLINVARDGRKTNLPIIDPFRYSARIKRFYGERFASVHEGLEVIGEVLPIADRISIVPIFSSYSEEERDGPDTPLTPVTTSSAEIVIYADDEEVETTLCQLISNSWDEERKYLSNETRDYDDDEPIVCNGVNLYLGSLQTVALFSIITIFTIESKADVPDEKEIDQQKINDTIIRPGLLALPKAFVRSSRDLDKSSSYNLPIRQIQVVLPNRSIVVAEDCALKIKADGTQYILEGIGGVHVEGEEVLVPNSSWTVDIINKNIVLQPKGIQLRSSFATEGQKTNFDVGLGQITKLSTGISEILKLRRLVSRPQTPQGHRGVGKTSDWSLKLNGSTSINF